MELSLKRNLISLILLLASYSLAVHAETTKSPERSVKDVVLFSMDYCPSCMAAKKYLNEREIAFSEFNIDQSEQARDVFERLGGMGAPFFLIDGRRVQGFHPHHFDQLLTPSGQSSEGRF